MNTAERLDASAQRFADTLSRVIETRVELALRLERDRSDDAIDSLAADVRSLRHHVDLLRAEVYGVTGEHSVRVVE